MVVVVVVVVVGEGVVRGWILVRARSAAWG